MSSIPSAGPFKFIEMDEGIKAPWYVLLFDKHGLNQTPLTSDHLLSAVKDDKYTDVFLFSHGWNNDWHDAIKLYEKFLDGYREMQRQQQLTNHTAFNPLLIGIFWPSISLVLPNEQSPTFATNPQQVRNQSDQEFREMADIAVDLNNSVIERFYALAHSQENLNWYEAIELAKILAPFYDRKDDEISNKESALSTTELIEMWRTTSLNNPRQDTSGKFGYTFKNTPTTNPQSASVIRFLDPRWPLRTLTVLRMKDRAGTVGAHGVGTLLRELLSANKTARFHLIGHSYGCKVMLSALCFRELPRPANSLLLLQPAVSYLCFAQDALGTGQPGGYRSALERVEQPILATFSRHDKALTTFFHLAIRRPSDFAEQRIAGMPPSRYAALGGYGPGGCETDCKVITIKDIGEDYDLEGKATKIYGLNSTKAIRSHGAISNRFTWWALHNQIVG